MFREDGTQLVAQENIATCQADDERIHGLRIRRSLPFFADVMGQTGFARGDFGRPPMRRGKASWLLRREIESDPTFLRQ